MSRIRIIFIILLLALCNGESLHAQMSNKAPDEFRGMDRWSFKTNLFGWAATLPNFTAEMELSPSPFNRMTLSLGAKYNWNTWQNALPYQIFNLLSVRPEFRYYYRIPESDDPVKYAKRQKGAYYFGAYADAGAYTLKLSEIGNQGIHVGLGFSCGYAMPMYQYRKGALDVEFGCSVGLAMASADAFRLNSATNTYDHSPDNSKGFSIVPYPVISEVNIAFVWRRASIKHKYFKVDKQKALEKAERKEKKKRSKDSESNDEESYDVYEE